MIGGAGGVGEKCLSVGIREGVKWEVVGLRGGDRWQIMR
jgi:hypothetical protein